MNQDKISEPELEIHGEVPDLPAAELIAPLSVLDEMSEEEILFWASPYFDELQAKKEAHKQKLAEESNI